MEIAPTTDFAYACNALVKESAAFELRVTIVCLRLLNDGIAVAPASNIIELREDIFAT